MREWRRCDRCGITRCGACPMCYPWRAEQELQRENAEALAAEEARRRRDAGMIFCPDHETYDGCIRVRTAAEVRAELRSEERRPGPGRRLTWQEAMTELRRRYVSP